MHTFTVKLRASLTEKRNICGVHVKPDTDRGFVCTSLTEKRNIYVVPVKSDTVVLSDGVYNTSESHDVLARLDMCMHTYRDDIY